MKPVPITRALLACGCELVLTDNPQGVRAVVQRKAETCGVSIHVAGMPLYDHRAAVRPSTRVHHDVQPDWEDG
jgi:hypothetical protein